MSTPAAIVFSAVAQVVQSFHAIAAASVNATVIKASPGFLTSIYASNSNAAARYLKLYDKATAPVVGTDVPVCTILVPPGLSIAQDMSSGYKFVNGIAFAMTTGIADTDNVAVGANDMAFSGQYC